MKEIFEQHNAITYEKPKVDIKSVKRKSNAKSFRGVLTGDLMKVRNDKNFELEFLINRYLELYNKFHTKADVELEGWKGKGSLEIYKGVENNFRIKEFIAGKNDEDDKEIFVEILKEDLNKMIFIIKKLTIGEPVKCYYIAKKLGYEWKELWKERKEYFQFYYFPIKILESLGIINYSGRGTITRLI